jgi:hypothetical protein
LVACCLAVGCTGSVDTPDAGATDAGATDAGATDAGAARDAVAARDVARVGDAVAAPDRPAPAGPFFLRDSAMSGCRDLKEDRYNWIYHTDTFYPDGQLRRLIGGGQQPTWSDDLSAALPGGVDDVLRLRRDVEATGILDLPEGTYPAASETCYSHTLEYRRADRTFAWSIVPTAGAPTPPAALTAALAVVGAAAATAR